MEKKKTILVIECISSGRMYVPEIIERGYKVILVQPKSDDKHLMEQKEAVAEDFSKRFNADEIEIFFTDFDAQAILEAIKVHIPHIVCSVAGSEMGVRLNDEVAKAIGVDCNDPATSYMRCTKAGMVEALEKSGVRAIKSQKVTGEEDIKAFFKDNDLKKAFMKFSESAASFESKVCESVEEAVAHFNKISNMPNYFGNEEDEILIQEYIEGDEYVVNTISCQGKHIITDIWKYDRIVQEDGSVVYNSCNFIRDIDDEIQGLIDYSYKVLDAVEMKFGPCHGEFKIDDKGPVLIETNCRPMGFSTTRSFQWELAKNYIVDWALNAYLDQDKFLKKISEKKTYRGPKSGRMKMVILPQELTGDMSALYVFGEHLMTYHNHNDYAPVGIKTYPKTEDLGDTPLILKLVGDTEEEVEYDLNLMRELELKYIDLVVTPDPNLKAGKQHAIEELVESPSLFDHLAKTREKSIRTLIVTDKMAYEYANGEYKPVNSKTDPRFDQVAYCNAKADTLANKFLEIFDMFSYLKRNGKAFIDDSVVDMLPYGRDCFELLKRAARI